MSGIFISYRREDTAAYAGRLYDRLSAHFGKQNVFIDVDTIEPGVDFFEVLEKTIRSCDVLISVIGKQWLTSQDDRGSRRLDDPEDLVRFEIAAALDRNIRVIPILVGGATMPRSHDLPEALAKLARRHAIELSDTGFQMGIARLIDVLQKAISGTEEPKTDQTRSKAVKNELAAVREKEPSSKPENVTLNVRLHVQSFKVNSYGQYICGVALTADGQRAVSVSNENTVKVWEVHSGREIRTLKARSNILADFFKPLSSVAVSADGRRAVFGVGESGKALKIWDLESGSEVRALIGHSSGVNGVALTADGRRAISASTDKTLKVWDLDTGCELRTLEGHTDRVRGVAVTTDGRRAISASDDKTLKVWDLESGSEVRTLLGHSLGVNGAAVTADGRRAISASTDKTLKVWDLDSGCELRTLEGHTDWVWGVAVTTDGRFAASAGDRTLRIWSVDTGQTISMFACESAAMTCCAISGFHSIVAGDTAGKIHFLKLEEVV